MKKVRWGILGTARIALNAFLPGLEKADNGVMAAIAGRSPEKVRQFVERFPALKPYDSYDALLDDEQIDAVYIPLPNSLHLEWTLKALEKNKAVLCEKPLVLKASEVKTIQLASQRSGKPVMEAFAYRHNPLIIRLKEIVDSGEIGTIKCIISNFTFNLMHRPDDIRFKKELGGGATYDVGCYPIHLIRTLKGQEPVEIQSKRTMQSGIDIASSGTMTFKDGSMGLFHCGFDQSDRTFCEILGTEGAFRTDQPFNQQGKLLYQIRKNKDAWKDFWIESPSNYQLEAQQFGRVILDEESPLLSLNDSFHNALIIDQVLGNPIPFAEKR